ncbi:MAG: hypothetical protein ACRD9L_14835, partial [Bryobacteraceae bacterium]
LEGVARMMHDFFGCEEAMVLDEGYDTFLIINPNDKSREDESDKYRYDNDDFLCKVASFTKWRAEEDEREYLKSEFQYLLDSDVKGVAGWPLNTKLYKDLQRFCVEKQVVAVGPDESDVVAVPPNRSQMRAVLILAARIPQ